MVIEHSFMNKNYTANIYKQYTQQNISLQMLQIPHTIYVIDFTKKVNIKVIKLVQWTLCCIQYIGKSKIQFNLKLKNHCKNVYKNDLLQADQHFKLPHHNFNQLTRCKLIEQLHNLNIATLLKIATLWLKKQDNFWIMN